MKETLARFDKGLALGPPPDSLVDGYLVRARGMNSLSQGSFRSRPGSRLLHPLNAHSIVYFNDIYHLGVSTSLYRAMSEIKTSLSGSRLAFAKMAPVAGIAAYLFCAGGGSLFKVDSSGNVTSWGFDAPASDPTGAASAGGSLTAATYKYQITYYNSATGHRSNGNGTDIEITTAAANLTASLSSIPDGSSVDSQITHVEIWRSVADGDALFYLTRIATGTTSYDDDGSITLSSVELPTDNLAPYPYFSDCFGPHNASIFWITRTESGRRGRVFYSPIGRTESLQGFINVCSDASPLQRLFLFQSQLGVIGEAGIYLIGGTNPYVDRQITGCPGTTRPDTVAVIPEVGVIYEASDGVRIFNGTTSDLITPGAVERLFRGESAGDFTSIKTGSVGAYARNAYYISDATQTLIYDISGQRWRDGGVGMNTIYYNEESDEIAASISSELLAFEDENSNDDNGTAIPLSLEPRHITFPDDRKRILQHVTFDINCASQSISVVLIHDGIETTIATLSTTTRLKRTIPVGIEANEFGIRFTGSLSAKIELHSVTLIFNDLTTGKEA